MTLTRRANYKVWLNDIGTMHGASSGDLIDGYEASAAILPGEAIELFSSSNKLVWRRYSTEDEVPPTSIALDQPYLNRGLTDAYAAGDGVDYLRLAHGTEFYGLGGSGATIVEGTLCEAEAGGTFKEAGATTATAGLAKFQSLSDLGASAIAVDTRCSFRYIGG